MAKSLKLRAFPEEITADGIKICGETSYENQIAVLSHYLHNAEVKVTKKRKEEIITSVREFLSRKQFRQGMTSEELSDEDVSQWDLDYKHELKMDSINKRSHIFIVIKFWVLILTSILFIIGLLLKTSIIQSF